MGRSTGASFDLADLGGIVAAGEKERD